MFPAGTVCGWGRRRWSPGPGPRWAVADTAGPRSGVCACVSREHEADGLGEAEPSTRGAEGE